MKIRKFKKEMKKDEEYYDKKWIGYFKDINWKNFRKTKSLININDYSE